MDNSTNNVINLFKRTTNVDSNDVARLNILKNFINNSVESEEIKAKFQQHLLDNEWFDEKSLTLDYPDVEQSEIMLALDFVAFCDDIVVDNLPDDFENGSYIIAINKDDRTAWVLNFAGALEYFVEGETNFWKNGRKYM